MNLHYPVVYCSDRKTLRFLVKQADAVYGNHFNFELLQPLLFSLRKQHCIVVQDKINERLSRFLFQSKLFRTDHIYAATQYLAKIKSGREHHSQQQRRRFIPKLCRRKALFRLHE